MSGGEKAELEQRLKALRAERAELELKRAEGDSLRQLREQVEAEERAVKDAAAIAEAEAEHGPVGRKIAVVDTDLGAIVVKRPHPAIYKRFQDSGSMKSVDLEKLVRPSLVYPDAATIDRILDELPATLVRLANAIAVLAGTRAEEVSGK